MKRILLASQFLKAGLFGIQQRIDGPHRRGWSVATPDLSKTGEDQKLFRHKDSLHAFVNRE